jgi:hypothetical protein
MSNNVQEKELENKKPSKEIKERRNLIGFLVLGIAQLIFFIGSFFLGFLSGYICQNDAIFYPYNRNAKAKGQVVLILAGIANAVYIALNKRIRLKKKSLNIGMKASIPLFTWGLSNFVIYELGYRSSYPLWDHVSTLYGVYDRRKTK